MTDYKAARVTTAVPYRWSGMRRRAACHVHPAMLLAAVMASVLGIARTTWADLADDVRALAGGQHTRLVWLRGGDRLWGGGTLMGFDTETRQTTTILGATYRQNRPILCTNGGRVVLTIDDGVYVVNWDGSGKRFVTSGMASDVWVEPGSGIEWVIYRTGSQDIDGRYYRRPIDNPSSQVVQLCGRGGGFEQVAWWQVSADGTMGTEFLPYPWFCLMRNAALDIVQGTDNIKLRINASTYAEGCWSSAASDNSYYSFHFNKTSSGASHGALYVFRDTEPVADVSITAGPLQSGTRSDEFYHPKFASNGGQFLTLTGGYTWNDDNKVEVYFGKFNSLRTGFAGWVRVTSNSSPDYMPDAWVGVGAQSASIQLNPTSLAFQADAGGANPAAQNVTVSSPTGTLSGVTAQSDQTWLGVTVTDMGGGTFAVTNQVNIAGLSSGQHTATVTVSASNASPPTNTYTATLTIGAQQAASIAITPSNGSTHIGSQVQFSAQVLDQAGQPMAQQPAVTWSLAGAGNATLSTSGLFLAGTQPVQYTVAASASGLQSSTTIMVYKPITITSPTGGEHFAAGSPMRISWTATDNVVGVVIMFSPNGGESWHHIMTGYVTRTSPSWGAYDWLVPSSVGGIPVASNSCLIRLHNYTDEGMQDISPAPFTVPVVNPQDATRSESGSVVLRLGGAAQVSVPWDGPFRAVLVDVAGRTLTRFDADRPRDLGLERGLQNGMYLLRLRGDNGREAVRAFTVQ
ncbi:MAG: hypothetical protein GF331_08980 [Chitinivibrionales bacterium]|nr:hypothetical protein [Chitinivibrionales bacterium]